MLTVELKSSRPVLIIAEPFPQPLYVHSCVVSLSTWSPGRMSTSQVVGKGESRIQLLLLESWELFLETLMNTTNTSLLCSVIIHQLGVLQHVFLFNLFNSLSLVLSGAKNLKYLKSSALSPPSLSTTITTTHGQPDGFFRMRQIELEVLAQSLVYN